MEGMHEYDRTLLIDDKRRFVTPFDVPVLANELVSTARTWATLHASASDETRERLVAAVADALGVVLVIG